MCVERLSFVPNWDDVITECLQTLLVLGKDLSEEQTQEYCLPLPAMCPVKVKVSSGAHVSERSGLKIRSVIKVSFGAVDGGALVRSLKPVYEGPVPRVLCHQWFTH